MVGTGRGVTKVNFNLFYALMPQDEDVDDPRAVERQRVEYLRRHREQTQLRYRLEAERRGEEKEADAAAMRVRRDDVRAAKRMEEAVNRTLTSALKTTRSLPGIYARLDDLGVEELQVLADRYQVSGNQHQQRNTRGKYHIQYMRDAYPIAGSQLKLEKEREMEIAAKRKLLLTDASSLAEKKSYGSRDVDRGVLSLGVDRVLGRSKLDYYVDKFATGLKSEQGLVKRTEAERHLRLCQVQHREGMEQFWRLMHAAPKREVIAWLKFHSFLDVNMPVRIVSKSNKDDIIVCEDRTLGVTPLMTACRSLCVDLVRCLLDNGAVVWSATANGDTALHFLWRDWMLEATCTDTVKDVATLMLRTQRVQDILEILIEKGVEVNAQNAFGETALQFCARYGLYDCAKLLLAHGAKAFTRDRKGNSAVQYAQDKHYEGLHQLLLHYETIERVRVKEQERRETTALLNQKRGSLTQPPREHFYATPKMGKYVDCTGQVIVCPDEDK